MADDTTQTAGPDWVKISNLLGDVTNGTFAANAISAGKVWLKKAATKPGSAEGSDFIDQPDTHKGDSIMSPGVGEFMWCRSPVGNIKFAVITMVQN